MQSGLHKFSPAHIKSLWTIRQQEREDLRSRDTQLDYTLTPKQWINDLPPIAQAKLWNNDIFSKTIDPSEFKYDSKQYYLDKYGKGTAQKDDETATPHTLPSPHQLSRMDRKMDTMTTALPTTVHHIQATRRILLEKNLN